MPSPNEYFDCIVDYSIYNKSLEQAVWRLRLLSSALSLPNDDHGRQVKVAGQG